MTESRVYCETSRSTKNRNVRTIITFSIDRWRVHWMNRKYAQHVFNLHHVWGAIGSVCFRIDESKLKWRCWCLLKSSRKLNSIARFISFDRRRDHFSSRQIHSKQTDLVRVCARVGAQVSFQKIQRINNSLDIFIWQNYAPIHRF